MMGRVCPKGAMTTPRHDNRSIPVARETIAIGDEIKKLMKTYVQFPPRKQGAKRKLYRPD